MRLILLGFILFTIGILQTPSVASDLGIDAPKLDYFFIGILGAYLFVEGMFLRARLTMLRPSFNRLSVRENKNSKISAESDLLNKQINTLTIENEKLKGLINKAQEEKLVARQELQIDAARQVGAFLGQLQTNGKFIDFLMSDISKIEDARVGSVARYVHQGSRKVVLAAFNPVSVVESPEGQRISLKDDYDPSKHRLSGAVGEKPPYTGTLIHRGWKASKVEVATVNSASKEIVLAPAEIEINK